ncbi:flavodoxin domain-containing protein [Lacticaseibacillus sp. GG6-2]
MAKILVVYQSQTGFTQQFALWLAKGLHCELLDTKFVTEADFTHCELVIYGGHVMGKQIAGFHHFYRQYQALLPEALMVFGTGVLRLPTYEVARIRARNFRECELPPQFYYLRGQATLAPLPLRLRVRLHVQGYRDDDDCETGRRAVQPVLDAVARMDPTAL